MWFNMDEMKQKKIQQAWKIKLKAYNHLLCMSKVCVLGITPNTYYIREVLPTHVSTHKY